MEYCLYYVPNFVKNGQDFSKYRLVSKHKFAATARMAAIRFINKGEKVCVITSKKPDHPRDFIWLVQYQDGKKWWKDPARAKEETGYVFSGFGKAGSTFVNGKDEVKRRL